jgi:hypothetical protein
MQQQEKLMKLELEEEEEVLVEVDSDDDDPWSAGWFYFVGPVLPRVLGCDALPLTSLGSGDGAKMLCAAHPLTTTTTTTTTSAAAATRPPLSTRSSRVRSTTRPSRDHDGSHDGSGAWEARAAREGPEHAATQQEEEEGYGDEDDDDGDGDDDDGGGDGCVAVSIGCAGEWSYEWDVVKLSGGKCKVRRWRQ